MPSARTRSPRRSWHAPVLEVLSVFSAPIAAFDQSATCFVPRFAARRTVWWAGPYRLQLVGAVGAVYFALLALVRVRAARVLRPCCFCSRMLCRSQLLELPVRAVHATADVDLIRRWRRHLTAMTDAKTGDLRRVARCAHAVCSWIVQAPWRVCGRTIRTPPLRSASSRNVQCDRERRCVNRAT